MPDAVQQDGLVARVRGHMRGVARAFSHLHQSGLWWLLPLAFSLLLLSFLLAAIAGTGPLAPFIYPLL